MITTKHTSGPWRIANLVKRWHDAYRIIGLKSKQVAQVSTDGGRNDSEETLANARLIAASPDHALVLRLITSGKAMWRIWGPDHQGELCIDGVRYATKLDEFGCPELHPLLRAAISKADNNNA